MESFLHISVDRQRLAAGLHLPTTTSGDVFPLVLFCHGLTGTRVGTSYRMFRLARALSARGIAALRFDFRGCGESDGRFEDLTTHTQLEDLLAVHASIAENPRLDTGRVAIVASSFGAFTAARAAPKLPGLRCLVFLAPVADPHALLQRDMNEPAWAFLRANGWIEHHGLQLGAAFIDTLPRGDVPALLANLRLPLRIYHGLHDRNVPIDQARRYVNAARHAGGTVELIELDTDDHGMRGVRLTDAILSGSLEWIGQFL